MTNREIAKTIGDELKAMLTPYNKWIIELEQKPLKEEPTRKMIYWQDAALLLLSGVRLPLTRTQYNQLYYKRTERLKELLNTIKECHGIDIFFDCDMKEYIEHRRMEIEVNESRDENEQNK